MMRSTRALGYAGLLVLVSCVSIRPERSSSVPKVDQRVAVVMNTPGCVAFWDCVKREPAAALRFAAHVPPGATNDYPLDAANYVRDFWGEGREATYADFPLLGRGPFGQAIRIRKEEDETFRPFLFVPRERLHDTPLDIKGAGKSVSVVVWAIRESGNHALAGIWHEGTDLKQQETAAIQKVPRGQRQYALFAGLNKEGSACGHVSENGASSFLNKYALHKCNSAAQSPAVPADSPADVLDAAWQCFAMTFDHEKDELTGWLNGVSGDRWLENPKNDTLTWRGHEFVCLDTRGNSPGSMTYVLQHGGRTFAFSGDLMLEGAKMHTWFDTEWDYGFATGIQALRQSLARLSAQRPALLLPSHGNIIRAPQAQLGRYAERLARLEKLYVRGYDPEGGSVAYQDKVSTPTVVSNVFQVSPHLFKFKRPNFWPNFGLILADSGRALVVDCGLLDEKFLDAALDGLRQHFGTKAIEAVVITHMHGDHFIEGPHLREKWGAKIWALDNMVDKMEHPEWFDYAAPIQAYGKKNADGSRINGVTVDRAFKPGERFVWEGYEFTVDWMPGQTEFALCLHGMIDGRKVAFTGDNIFGDPADPRQTGHEAVVARNSAILEEGYIYAGEYLKRLQPDILIGGHSFVMDRPAQFIERYRRWSYEMRKAFQDLSSEKDYRYWFDPFWVRAEPYRVSVRHGERVEVRLQVRNFQRGRQAHRIEIHTPPDLVAEPSVLEGHLAGRARESFPVVFKALPGGSPGTHLVAFDVTLDGRRYGLRFDAIINVAGNPGTSRP